jgi:uncharacterized protein (TIGR03067 family)
MKRPVLMVLAAGLLVAADTPEEGEDRLQGTWHVVRVEKPDGKGGREAFDFADDKFSLTFDHGSITSTAEGKTLWQGTYHLHSGNSPAAIDIARRSGPFKHGIYQLKGDSLRLCLDLPGNPRPTRYSPPKDSPAEVMVFKREKPRS